MKTVIIGSDKEAINSTVTALKIRWPNVKTVTTHSGIEGVDIVRNALSDLVIIDLDLADLDGIEVIKSIRLFSDVPVITISYLRDNPEEAVNALESGADEHMIKPLGLMEFVSRVNSLLRRRKTNVA